MDARQIDALTPLSARPNSGEPEDPAFFQDLMAILFHISLNHGSIRAYLFEFKYHLHEAIRA